MSGGGGTGAHGDCGTASPPPWRRAGEPASLACISNTRLSNSSSSVAQRSSHARASCWLGAPNQSRSRTRANQAQTFSYSLRISSASSYVKFRRNVSNSISLTKSTSQFSMISA